MIRHDKKQPGKPDASIMKKGDGLDQVRGDIII